MRERVEAVLELVPEAATGKPFAQHVASLTVGAAVSWTNKSTSRDTGGDTSGTIVEVREKWEGETLWHTSVVVRGESSGKTSKVTPAAAFKLQA
eukprot:SAG11_NODE_2692_length_3090_cov_2.761618_4_plen_94_part_00